MQTLIVFVSSLLCATIPILMWGYLFSFMDSDEMNRKRFIVWIVAGVISVFPILKLSEILDFIQMPFFNIFSKIHALIGIVDIFPALLAFLFILFLLSCIPFLLLNSFKIDKAKSIIFGKNFLIFSLYSAILLVAMYLLQKIFGYFHGFNMPVNANIAFGDIMFNSVKLVILYYIVIGVMEELSKFFCFTYSRYFEIKTQKQWVLSAIFVALGFAFFENILYFQSLYENYGLGKELVFSYFSRNLFSVVLHVLCSSVFAYFFTKAYLHFHYRLHKNFLIWIFIGYICALSLHALFDIFLTFNLTIMVILYLLGSYFYITYIFYWDEAN